MPDVLKMTISLVTIFVMDLQFDVLLDRTRYVKSSVGSKVFLNLDTV